MSRRNTFICITFLAISICLSCTTTRRHGRTLSAPELAKTLSSRLGIQVTTKDNLELYDLISKWIGTPHRMGQSSMKGTDCSGFVSVLYKNIYGKNLERSSAAMLKVNCRKVTDQKNLREGDLVFFYTGRLSQTPSHVGIYLKDRKFAHSSTTNGVTISSLDEPYYVKRWISGGIVK
ncbi:MAG: C40 family peptidase [Tannerella sp.]|nr:C40 family peptidase [Tannerella sp.]